ncbi:MAG TPA: zinc-binding dehydrogenase [Hyphomonadaceae bacterium]|nr:zinc-binding dehydrogenase [Hyphomonadaceae bacterium]HPN05835.1 zinc-binding dehydrogenase [Hyphomonadaceae bacterium]
MALEGLQLRSHVKKSGELELTLAKVAIADPAPDEIVVRIEGTPINPSDLGLLIGPADLSTAVVSGTKESPVVTAKIPEVAMRAMAARTGEAMPVGNEGAGTVVAAGSSPEAQALMGKMVAILGGEMYATYRTVKAKAALPLPAGATAADGASCFVNPLTALAMVKTMQLEGHTALVHTAAASNLGQMLNKICIKDGVDLVNIVRSDEQAKILKDIGAKYIVDSSKPTFMEDLIAALSTTGATLAFDAIGGGKLAGQILGAMEIALNSKPGAYSRYGSSTHKQVYIYGRLSLEPTILGAAYGMAWGVGGFLLTPFLQKVGMEEAGKMRARVAAELKTTFASHYTNTISLRDALDLETIKAYNRKATGEKYLINPSL